jgi:anti-sigma factor RsiW
MTREACEEAAAEVERLRELMIALVSAPFDSDQWNAAMDAIGEEVVNEVEAREAAEKARPSCSSCKTA